MPMACVQRATLATNCVSFWTASLRPLDLFDAHLPLMRYEQQQGVGLAVRKYVMMRRGVLASDAQRKPAGALSATAKTEIEYLLSRLARFDKRAALAPPLARAS